MKVLLFGGAGYIGTHVAMAFLDRGDTVGIFDNLSTGLRSNVPEKAEFFEGDILDRARVAEVLSRGWDAAVHLAAFKAAVEMKRAGRNPKARGFGDGIQTKNINADLNARNKAFWEGK